jgi:hypothetical protein
VDYWRDPALLLAPLPRELPDNGLSPKARVLGVWVAGQAVAVVLPAQPPSAAAEQEVTVGGSRLRLTIEPGAEGWAASAQDTSGKRPWQTTCFWGAWWSAFPETKVAKMPARQ